MAGKPSFQFYPGDWKKDPALRGCSFAARGFWIEVLCDIFNSESMGTIEHTAEELARMSGGFPDEVRACVRELSERDVADVVELEGGRLRITSRRLKREAEQRKDDRERKRREREAQRAERERKKAGRKNSGTPSGSLPSNVRTMSETSPSRAHAEEEVEEEVEEGIEKEESENFGEPWSDDDVEAIVDLYPRQVGRRKAIDAVRDALDRIASRKDAPPNPVAWLEDRVQQFANSPAGDRGQFTPYPNNWFDDDRFDDDPAEWTPAKPKNGSKDLLTYREALDVVNRNQGRTMKDLFQPVKQGDATLFQPIT